MLTFGPPPRFSLRLRLLVSHWLVSARRVLIHFRSALCCTSVSAHPSPALRVGRNTVRFGSEGAARCSAPASILVLAKRCARWPRSLFAQASSSETKRLVEALVIGLA